MTVKLSLCRFFGNYAQNTPSDISGTTANGVPCGTGVPGGTTGVRGVEHVLVGVKFNKGVLGTAIDNSYVL